MDKHYYDGTKLLSLKDINGERPEIYISTSNRSAGKTTYFARWFVRRFLEHNEKFMLFYRFNYELSDVSDKFFRDVQKLFFPGYEMKAVSRNKNVYVELFLNDKSCGYAIAINNSDQIKKLSHLFSDVERILFDEFQSETNRYCSGEVEKVISIHTSIARGNGKQVRYLPMFLIGNFVTVLNPYYCALGIAHRIQTNTNYLKGDGFVLEQAFYQNVADMQKESAFNRAFKNSAYTKFATDKIYLNDNLSFVEKMSGNLKYVVTIKYKNKKFGLFRNVDNGLMYCAASHDASFPVCVCASPEDHDNDTRLISRSDALIYAIKNDFDMGNIRFQNLECKEVIFNLLSYSIC